MEKEIKMYGFKLDKMYEAKAELDGIIASLESLQARVEAWKKQAEKTRSHMLDDSAVQAINEPWHYRLSCDWVDTAELMAEVEKYNQLLKFVEELGKLGKE